MERYVSNHLAYYTSGRTSYERAYGTTHDIPAEVFTDPDNLDEEGNWSYTYNEDDNDVLNAVEVIGFTIYWERYEE